MKQIIFTLLFSTATLAVYGQQWDSLKTHLYFYWADTCLPYHVEMNNYLRGDEDFTYVWFLENDSLTGDMSPDFVIADTGYYHLYCSVYKRDKLVHRDTIGLSFYSNGGDVFAGPRYYGCGHPDFTVYQTDGCIIEHIYVFNRWGEVLYQTYGLPEEPWDFETKDGAALQSGTYVCYIKYIDSFGNRRLQQTDFSIMH